MNYDIHSAFEYQCFNHGFTLCSIKLTCMQETLNVNFGFVICDILSIIGDV